MLPVVDVIIINWNGVEDTIDCLRSLTNQSYTGEYRAVVIDNNSSDNSINEIITWCHEANVKITGYQYNSSQEVLSLVQKSAQNVSSNDKFSVSLIAADDNLGFCQANNLGVEHSVKTLGVLSLILNNDTICDSELLSGLVEASLRLDHKCILSPMILYNDNREVIWWNGGTFSSWLSPTYTNQGDMAAAVIGEFSDTEWVSGCATLIPNHIYKRIGLYDPVFFIWCDEWDLSIRARNAGITLKVIHNAKVNHKVGRSLGIIGPLVYYYSFRNMAILRHRHLSTSRWILFNCLYIPVKFFQSIVYSIKQNNLIYLKIFFYFFKGGYGYGGGKWKRQTN